MDATIPKIHMIRALTSGADHDAEPTGLRAMTPEDIPRLGKLFLAAYVGTVDYEGESEQEATAAVQATFKGEFGEFLGAASSVIERSNKLVSASFITLWQGQPLLAFSVTAPEHKGSGLAGKCIGASMQALVRAGYEELHLFVTATNASALSVYNRLGFSVASAASQETHSK